METTHLNLLTLTEYYLIRSKKTQKPYIDPNGSCYLFSIKKDAEAFSTALEDTYVDEPRHYRLQFITEIYGYGIKTVMVKQKTNDFEKIPVLKGDAKREYANPKASLNTLLLKQTLKKKYMRELKNAVFLAPILIDPRAVKRYPEMHYSYATFDGNTKYYCLFTTISEFNTWNLSQEQNWMPVEMPLYKVGRIRKNNPVIINPASDMIILSDKQISEILKG
ncbi:MAG: hypothetical protein K6G10_06755 [Butyrivibrio sp.]|nr:hypothetical protein [Butyrivibrio sp.]